MDTQAHTVTHSHKETHTRMNTMHRNTHARTHRIWKEMPNSNGGAGDLPPEWPYVSSPSPPPSHSQEAPSCRGSQSSQLEAIGLLVYCPPLPQPSRAQCGSLQKWYLLESRENRAAASGGKSSHSGFFVSSLLGRTQAGVHISSIWYVTEPHIRFRKNCFKFNRGKHLEKTIQK